MARKKKVAVPAQVMEEQTKPVNATLKLTQGFGQTKIVRRKDKDTGEVKEVVVPVKNHFMEFRMESLKDETPQSLSNWILLKLGIYQKHQQIRGGQTFDQSAPITLDIIVNDVAVTDSLKFNVNAKRIEKLITDYPNLIGDLFNPAQYDHHNLADVKTALLGSRNFIIASPKKVMVAVQDAAVEEVKALINA